MYKYHTLESHHLCRVRAASQFQQVIARKPPQTQQPDHTIPFVRLGELSRGHGRLLLWAAIVIY